MAIRWDKLTVKAQEAIQRAGEIASEHANPEIVPVHLLAALVEDKEGIVPPLLEKIGVQPNMVLTAAMREIERLPKLSNAAAQPSMSDGLSRLLDQAFKAAANFKDEYVSTEHLLLAMADIKKDPAQTILISMGRGPRQYPARTHLGSRNAERYRPESGSEISGTAALFERPDGAGAAGKA